MNSQSLIQCSDKVSVRQFIQRLGLSKWSYTYRNTSIAALGACNNHYFLIINTRIFWILGFRDVCTCVFFSKIMKQVITSSDLHFIFFLELTQIIIMAVLYGMAVVFLIFMGFIVVLPSVCVCVISLSLPIVILVIQPLEFPKCAWCRWATLLCLDEEEDELEQHLLALVQIE
jgi:hypothetical protein